MSGKIKKMIDAIIKQRSKGSPIIASTLKVKLILKGIYPDKFTDNSDDNPVIIKKIEQIAADLGVDLYGSTPPPKVFSSYQTRSQFTLKGSKQ
jgi:hypothetical protein